MKALYFHVKTIIRPLISNGIILTLNYRKVSVRIFDSLNAEVILPGLFVINRRNREFSLHLCYDRDIPSVPFLFF